MLSHLVYVSTRTPSCTDEEIDKILASCIKNNSKLDVTGVLLYSKSNFVQYLEGDYSKVITLYDKIKVDQRHKNAILISSSPINQRTFPSWQMGSKKFDMTDIDFKTEISTDERKSFIDILAGRGQEGSKAIALIKKFFK